MSAILWKFENSLAVPFFGIEMKSDLFQSCGHCCSFPICWRIECGTLTASSFRVWNSSTRILSHPLALFVLMLPKACLTSNSRMSGSRWVITPPWLSGSLGSFLCFPGGSDGKDSSCNAGDPGSIPESGRSPGEENGNPFQYPCLENSMDREAWQATVLRVTKSQTWLSDFTFFLCNLATSS